MQFNHDGHSAVRLGVELANNRPANVDLLTESCRRAEVVFDGATPGDDDLRSVDEFLDQWIAMARTKTTEERVDALNVLLAAYAAAPRLTNHSNTDWHLHFRDDDVSPGQMIATLICVGTALHLAGRGIDRLGPCAASGCERLFADTSRNGRQRYCSPGCGNRAAVQRYRQARAS